MHQIIILLKYIYKYIMVFNLTNNDTELTIKNIEEKMKKGLWMVRYYADWCGHCKMMESDWKKFENKNKNKNIISFESQAMNKMNHQPENFEGFPTILMLNNNKIVKEFDQIRNLKNFQQFYDSTVKEINKEKKSSIGKNKKKNKKLSIKKLSVT